MVKRRTLELWIKDCKEKKCSNNGIRYHYHKPNPRGHAVKHLETTVLRAIRLVAAFDEVEKDWQDVPIKTYKEILGKDYYHGGRAIEEVWNRYKNGTLFGEILDLARNLPLKDIKKENPERAKEIRDGIARANT
jgi:hypothetical protein